MRAYAPLQRNSDKLWLFTCTVRGSTYPVGHCSTNKSCDKCEGEGYLAGGTVCETCQGSGSRRKEFPCEGHPTAEEACKHYEEFLVDTAKYQPDEPDAEKGRGRDCDAPGCKNDEAGYAQLSGGERHYFCASHLNRKGVRAVVSVAEFWES